METQPRERVAIREVVTEAADIEGDGEAEVFIVDKREQIR